MLTGISCCVVFLLEFIIGGEVTSWKDGLVCGKLNKRTLER